MRYMLGFSGKTRVKSRSKGVGGEVSAYKDRMRRVSAVVTLAIVVSLVVLVSYYLAGGFSGSESASNGVSGGSDGGGVKAALIDSLSVVSPNPGFTESVQRVLLDGGFDEVDVFRGGEVTVDFLRGLEDGYRLVILRMHSALASSGELYLFTAERYSVGRYVQEQSFRLVKEAYATEDSEAVFAVNWGFVRRVMAGKFEGALVVAMGCDGAVDDMMTEEFLSQGAVGYVGWNGPVLLSHSDHAVSCLVECLYREKMSLGQAVEKTNLRVGEDPIWETELVCYGS